MAEKKQRRHSFVLSAVVISIVVASILAFTIIAFLILERQGIVLGTTTLTIISIIVSVAIGLLGLAISFLQLHQPISATHTKPEQPSLPPDPSTAPDTISLTSRTTLPNAQETGTIPSVKSTSTQVQIDWGEAPTAGLFYGREKELAELKHKIMDSQCQIIAVLGMGGIGKTSLMVTLINQLQDDFAYVIWHSLRNAPPLQTVLQQSIQIIADQQLSNLPEDVNAQIALLTDYLRKHRCLLVLDNFETILQPGNHSGQYREGFESYAKLIQYLGNVKHKSCLLITSREKPKEVAIQEGENAPIQTYLLAGLEVNESLEILKDKGLFGTEKTQSELINIYGGNPLALKLVSQFIYEVFDGIIENFLKEGKVVFSDIREVLDHQFDRLSEYEQMLMYWLAIAREPISLQDLQKEAIHPVSKQSFQEALRSLRRRFLIEMSRDGFTLQNVVMEYISDKLIGQICNEIATEKISLLRSHAIIKAQAKDYIRDTQIHLILIPIVKHLLFMFERIKLEEKFIVLLDQCRVDPQKTDYAAGNFLNLLIQLGFDLRNYDFSHLTIWEAYLQDVSLENVNFAYANLARSVFAGTFGSINTITYSSRGNLLAAGASNGEIWIWQVPEHELLLILNGHTGWVRSVAFSPDGQVLASSSDDHTVRLWEVSTGRCLRVLQASPQAVYSVVFSADGNILISSSNREIALWKVTTGDLIRTLSGHTAAIHSVAVCPDGQVLASGSDDHAVRLWQISTGKCLFTLNGHTNWIRSVAFSQDGRILASGSADQTVKLWHVHTGDLIHTLKGHTKAVYSVAFSSDGLLMASGSADHSIRLWDSDTGRCVHILQGHKNWVRSLSFNPDKHVLASGSTDNTARLWEVSTGRCIRILQGYAHILTSIDITRDGQLHANGSSNGTVQIREVNSGRVIHKLQGHTSWVRSVSFSPDGQLLASGSDDQTVRLWKVSTGQYIRSLSGHTDGIWSVAFSSDGQLLASGSDDQTVRLWEVSTGQYIRSLSGHTNRVYSVALNPGGQLLASGSADHSVRLWEVGTGTCLRTLTDHTDRVRSVAFSSDGTLLASTGTDNTLRVFNINTGECIYILRGHTGEVYSTSFSPDSKLLASSSRDQTIRIWNVDTGRCVYTLLSSSGWVYAVTFSPDNQLLISCSENGVIQYWHMQSGECVRTFRSNKPYERMNITGISGLTEAQKDNLKALGAIEGGEMP